MFLPLVSKQNVQYRQSISWSLIILRAYLCCFKFSPVGVGEELSAYSFSLHVSVLLDLNKCTLLLQLLFRRSVNLLNNKKLYSC